MAEFTEKQALNPNAMVLDDAARILAALGKRRITREMLQADIDAGAPLNADGTLNLVDFAAWLVKEAAGTAGARHGD